MSWKGEGRKVETPSSFKKRTVSLRSVKQIQTLGRTDECFDTSHIMWRGDPRKHVWFYKSKRECEEKRLEDSKPER